MVLRHSLCSFHIVDGRGARSDVKPECFLGDSRFGWRRLFSGSLFGGSFLSGSCGGFGLGSCGSSFGFLLGYFFSLCFVLCYFGFETSFFVKLLLGCHRCAELVDALLLLSFPGVETTLCFGFVKSAFLYATLKMLHEKHAFVGEDGANGVGGLSTNVDPIQSTLEVQSYCSRISVRIIRTYPFNKFTISWCPAIGDNNRIERIVLATMTLQSDFCCH